MSESRHYRRVLAKARKLHRDGISFRDALPALRRLSPSPLDSIKAGRDAYGLSLRDSKLLVHFSDTWQDCRDAFDTLHAEAEAVADEL